MKRPLLNFIKLLLFIFLLIAVWNYQLVFYGVQQLNGQMKIVCFSVPITDVLKNPEIKEETKVKLKIIQEIRQFAIDSLGLNNSDNYTTLYDQKDKPLLFVVTGCKPYSLEAKKWNFPFVGEVSYKGFFKEHRAKKEERLIQQQGYETDIYSPSAWSTLGYFTDPILSNVLKRSNARLADLIIHELTHATVYLKSSVDFNENFATFIGETGAEKFLISKYGVESKEVINFRNYLSDEETYSKYMLKSSKSLDSLYKSLSPELTVQQKASSKYRMIAKIMIGLNQLHFNAAEKYKFHFKKDPLPNNTDFMAFLRYRKTQENFKKAYVEIYNSDLKYFLKDVVERTKNNQELPF